MGRDENNNFNMRRNGYDYLICVGNGIGMHGNDILGMG